MLIQLITIYSNDVMCPPIVSDGLMEGVRGVVGL